MVCSEGVVWIAVKYETIDFSDLALVVEDEAGSSYFPITEGKDYI